MNKVLSQEEIDALFSTMAVEDPGADNRREQIPEAAGTTRYEPHGSGTVPQDPGLRGRCDAQRNSREQKAADYEADRIYEVIRTMSVAVDGEILNSKLTLDSLLQISEGDIIELDEPIDDPIYLCVGGIAMFKGRIIQREGKKAFEILERFVD